MKLILGILLAGLVAVPAAAKPAHTTAVGKVHGTEAFLAVTYDGHRFTLMRGGALYETSSAETWVVLPNGDIRGAIVDPRPRRCRPMQVTLADGTTAVVTVCKTG